MDVPLIITIGLMVFIAAISAGLWARRPGVRPVVGGIGALLIPLGLYLFGLTHLAYNGVISIIDWAQRTVWSTTMAWGVSLLGVGIVLFVVSRFIKPAERKVATKPDAPTVAARPSTGRPAAVATGPAAQPVPQQKKSAEDDEVEDILRKRGLL